LKRCSASWGPEARRRGKRGVFVRAGMRRRLGLKVLDIGDNLAYAGEYLTLNQFNVVGFHASSMNGTRFKESILCNGYKDGAPNALPLFDFIEAVNLETIDTKPFVGYFDLEVHLIFENI
jgi:hypothetical protein